MVQNFCPEQSFSAIAINEGTLQQAIVLRQAIQAVRDSRTDITSQVMDLNSGSMSREEASTSNTALVFYYLYNIHLSLSSALYEFIIPIAVILSVPFVIGRGVSFLRKCLI